MVDGSRDIAGVLFRLELSIARGGFDNEPVRAALVEIDARLRELDDWAERSTAQLAIVEDQGDGDPDTDQDATLGFVFRDPLPVIGSEPDLVGQVNDAGGDELVVVIDDRDSTQPNSASKRWPNLGWADRKSRKFWEYHFLRVLIVGHGLKSDHLESGTSVFTVYADYQVRPYSVNPTKQRRARNGTLYLLPAYARAVKSILTECRCAPCTLLTVRVNFG